MNPFQYAILRAVPRVDRGEFINIGAVLHCQAEDFLSAALAIDDRRLLALDPHIDLTVLHAAADAVVRACAAPVGTARENSGLAIRFGMLTAPRSALIQPSPVHAGMTTDAAATLAHLVTSYVEPPSR